MALLRKSIVVAFTVTPLAFCQSVMLWNGVQSTQFFSGISPNCDSALNTTLNCPNSVQLLGSAHQFVSWNTTSLSQLCTSGCEQSLATLLTNVQSGCGSEGYPYNNAMMTWAQQIQYFQYKYGLLCMQDSKTSDYCLDVEAGWNITTMVSEGQATWPKNTTKCYLDVSESEPIWIVDVDGTCLNATVFENGMYVNYDDQPRAGQMQALDYYYNRTEMIPDDNYGWSSALEYDEYPLEIQCSSCWIDKFVYGYTNEWGDAWDDISPQIWANMQANCNLTQTITPANNISVFNSNIKLNDEPTFTPNLSLCLQVITGTQGSTCQQVALQNSIPASGLSNLNPGAFCQYLENQTLCAPQACPITVNTGDVVDVPGFVQNYTNFTQTQFLAWNRFIDFNYIAPGDSVCIGPPGGQYIPSTVVSAASSSVYTTTATPADPTPSGSIPNCGLWYEVQSGDYCDSIALKFSLTFAQLVDLNPSLNANCTNLFLGYDYCVAAVNGTSVTPVTPSPAPSTTASVPTTSSVTPSSTTTTTTSSAISTPTPTQSGMASGCTKFYQAASGDTCYQIAQDNGITTAQFEAWNPAVGSSCASLWVGYYYCVAQ